MKIGLYDVYPYWVYFPWEYMIKNEMFNICIHILIHLSRKIFDAFLKNLK